MNRTSSRNCHQIDFSKLVLGFLFSYTHLEALKKLRHHLAKCERCEPEAEKENDPPNDKNGQKKERANIDSSIGLTSNYILAKNLFNLKNIGLYVNRDNLCQFRLADVHNDWAGGGVLLKLQHILEHILCLRVGLA